MAFEDPETQESFRFWLIIAAGFVFCVALAISAVNYASPLFVGVILACGVGFITFYNPKIGLALLVFSMLLSPRLQGGSVSSQGGMGSSVEVRFDDIILMVVFLSWMARTAIVKGTSFLAGTPVHLPAFLYTSACVVSTLLAMLNGKIEYLRPVFFVLKYLQYFVLFFMTVNIVETRDDVRRFLLMAWLTALIVTCYGYAQIPQGNRVSTPFETPISLLHGDSKIADNEANTYGGYFMVVYGVLLAQFIFASGRSSFATLGSAAFMLAPFMMTLSRSSYIGLTFMILFLLFSVPRKRIALFLGVFGALVLILIVPTIREAVTHRIVETYSSSGPASRVPGGRGLRLEESAMYRVVATRRIVFELFPRSPVFGYGVTGVGLVDTQFPRILGETGLLGLSLFLWMIFRIWSMARVVYQNGEDLEDRAIGLGLMAALVGVLGHSYGANTFIIVRIMEPFWFLTAMAARIYINDRESFKPKEDEGVPLSRRMLQRVRHAQ